MNKSYWIARAEAVKKIELALIYIEDGAIGTALELIEEAKKMLSEAQTEKIKILGTKKKSKP